MTDVQTVMPIAPSCDNGMFGGGYGGEFWLILILLFAFGGFGNGGFGGGFGGYNDIYPWMNQSNQINEGFREQMLNTTVNGIQNGITTGFGDVQNSLCSGFAGVNSTINNAQNSLAQQLYTNQIADMERSFAAQTAQSQNMSALQSQLAQCCCDNRLATCQTQNIVQNEANATRFADAGNTRDIIDSQTRSTQAILDKLCALELDGYKRENDNLRTQLNMASLNASQTAQTAELRASQATTANQLVSELRSCPIPSQPVFGNQPIFTCGNNNYGCGCACGM